MSFSYDGVCGLGVGLGEGLASAGLVFKKCLEELRPELSKS